MDASGDNAFKEQPRRSRVRVHVPADPAEAAALRRAIVRDLAELAVKLAADERLPVK